MKTQKKHTNYPRILGSIVGCIVFFGFLLSSTQALPSLTNKVHSIDLQIDNPFMSVDGVSMKIDPLSDATPLIVPSWKRAMIPLRGVFEHMGASIEWIPEEKKIQIYQEHSSTEIVLQIHSPTAHVQGKVCWIDEENHQVSPFILHQRTYIPILFVGEALDAKVIWYPQGKFISIQWEEP
ncbi:MAG: copper amine oxidase N-terminal domain-containing protein [Caldisericia bacterium]|nr:copper amine oxidase N-terminal domain-containing protein [Caldisericia bacterium]MDD4614584.1 copper amine oxidase N-terminal domain-containing protein [Caldisericia bacterium]